jgi:hypothetical protein
LLAEIKMDEARKNKAINPTMLVYVLSNYLSNAFCDATNKHDGFDAEPREFYQAKKPGFVSSSAIGV